MKIDIVLDIPDKNVWGSAIPSADVERWGEVYREGRYWMARERNKRGVVLTMAAVQQALGHLASMRPDILAAMASPSGMGITPEMGDMIVQLIMFDEIRHARP